MLFNSATFIFLFLPIVLGLFYLLRTTSPNLALLSLIGASLFFYAWWNPIYLLLLLSSVVLNYSVALQIGKNHGTSSAKVWLTLGIVGDLSLLGYFKYANFFVENVNALNSWHIHMPGIILPLAISFFTFQQIAYLVDVYKRQAPHKYDFKHYCLFVTFFPQLIAGPIVHHQEIMPQFARFKHNANTAHNIEIGITFFVIGLFKKVVLADGVATYANPVFLATDNQTPLTFFAAWGGALAYTLQIYFDFSGYSDMAIGLARLFGIHLPINFNSPYKATNIIDFWRRWHITLSRFLRDYLYIPLGGNRKGKTRRYANLLITMLLGGLWHGAGWTFVFWGLLHGFYLMINHGWQALRSTAFSFLPSQTKMGKFTARAITFGAVTFAWVFFRATSFDSATNMLKGMAGLNGFVLHHQYATKLNHLGLTSGVDLLQYLGLQFGNPAFFYGLDQVVILSAMLLWVWFAPNSQEFMRYLPLQNTTDYIAKWNWAPKPAWAIFSAALTTWALLNLNKVSDFLYFRF